MKNLIYLLLITFLSSCSVSSPSKEILSLRVGNFQPISNKKNDNCYLYSVDMTVKNESDSVLSFWMMSCSWQDNFTINDPVIMFKPLVCDKNYPIKQKLSKGGSLSIRAIIFAKNKLHNSILKPFIFAFIPVFENEYPISKQNITLDTINLLDTEIKGIVMKKIKRNQDVIWNK